MTPPTETNTKPAAASNEERRPSLTERIKEWFPDLRTKRQQKEDQRQLEEDVAEERRSMQEDERRKKEIHERGEQKK